MFKNEDFETDTCRKRSGRLAPLPSEFLGMMDKTELKNVILELLDQQRELNARLAEKDRIAAEKDSMIASLSEKLDTLIAYQKEVKVDLEAWLAKERQWHPERQTLLRSNADLKDIIKVLKKEKFKGTSQKSSSKPQDKNDNGGSSASASSDHDLHTLLATCHARGTARMKYLKDFYHCLVKRQNDYANMVPGPLQ